MYCSDVAVAFDRVSSFKLLQKLRCSSVHPKIVQVISDWRVGRRCEVIVQGSSSDSFPLSDMTFQGIFWGPPLWNLFFADSPVALRKCGFQEVISAVDLNAFCVSFWIVFQMILFLVNCSVVSSNCTNGVQRIASLLIVIRKVFILSPDIPLLAVHFVCLVCSLICNLPCKRRLANVLSKVTGGFLRSRRYFSLSDLALLYKSHILSYIEYRTLAITHAATLYLNNLDSVQKRFLRNIGFSSFEALYHLNLAPLSTRRDIANLGFIFGPLPAEALVSCVFCLNSVPLSFVSVLVDLVTSIRWRTSIVLLVENTLIEARSVMLQFLTFFPNVFSTAMSKFCPSMWVRFRVIWIVC